MPQELVAQAGVEALDEPVLPGTSGSDVGRLGANGGDPLLHGLGHKLWAIVGANVARHPAQDEEIG